MATVLAVIADDGAALFGDLLQLCKDLETGSPGGAPMGPPMAPIWPVWPAAVGARYYTPRRN